MPSTPARDRAPPPPGRRAGCGPRQPVVVSGSEDATLRVWDYETGAFERALRGHLALVTAVDCDPSGPPHPLPSGAGPRIIIWGGGDYNSGSGFR